MPVRLQKRLLIYSLIISTIPLACLGIISYNSQKNVLEEQVRKTLITASYHASDTINRCMDERLSDLLYMSYNAFPHGDKGTNPSMYLKAYVENKPIYSGYIYVTKTGEILSENMNGALAEYFIKSTAYKRALQGETYFSRVFSLQNQKPSFLISTPIYNANREVIGVFAPTFNLYYLWKTVDEKLTPEMGSYSFSAMMINSDGLVVTDKKESQILNTNFLKENNFTLKKVEQSISDRKLLESKDGERLYSVDKIKQRDDADEQWFVITSVEKSTVYAPLKKLLSTYVGLSILLLLGIFAAVYYISRIIVRPVELTAASVQNYAEGKPFQIVESPYLEINTLNRAFTSMVEGIEQREKEILRTEKLKYVGQLAAGVAHEIRNPITTIRGFFQLLKDQPYNEQHFRTYINIIIEELNRMNNIVGELLDLSKPYQIIPKEYSISELLDEVIILQKGELSKRNIQIVNENICNGIIYTDRNRLYQVILNVIQNARDALTEGGKISFVTHCMDDRVKLLISDNGPGIPEIHLSKLGTPFFTTKELGTGLGVTTSMKIMEELQGSFEISSRVGQGTTVTLTIPTKKVFSI